MCLTQSGPFGHCPPESVPLHCNKHYHLHTVLCAQPRNSLSRDSSRGWEVEGDPDYVRFPHTWFHQWTGISTSWKCLSCWVWVKTDIWKKTMTEEKAGNPPLPSGKSMHRERTLHRSLTTHHHDQFRRKWPTQAHSCSLKCFSSLVNSLFLSLPCVPVQFLVLRTWKSQWVPCRTPSKQLHIINLAKKKP